MESTSMSYCLLFLMVIITTTIQAQSLDIKSDENISSNDDCKNGTCFQADSFRSFNVKPIKVGRKTYYVEAFFSADWFTAKRFCRYNNMRLASISNKEENDKLKQGLISSFGPELYQFWTSGNDIQEYGWYVWESTGEPFGFTDWNAGEPNHSVLYGEKEHCVEIHGYRGKWSWNDLFCSHKRWFICEQLDRNG